MIPKIIHYCWFSGDPFDEMTQKCIKSWETYCPDYEIRQCNAHNFDINSNAFAKEAYQCKKWAFVSDYARLALLYEYGGIYLDGDVEIIQNFDELLEQSAFMGQERKGWLSAGVIAAEAGNDAIRVFLDYYKEKHFINDDGTRNQLPNTWIMTHNLFETYGLLIDNDEQWLGRLLHIYPAEFFSPKDSVTGKITRTENTYAIHHFNGAWKDGQTEGIKLPGWTERIIGVGKIFYLLELIKSLGFSEEKRKKRKKMIRELRLYYVKRKISRLRKSIMDNLYE